ncbi:WYL domain-containing protein [Spongiibacter marinus]|uniref:WYL domain-containing protein n=1 Tax=Spongiibacter marinus TaxID=354246 RepID=UPI00041CFFB2|nr:WYL domain-containing protein [Spongiibacter marinus]
MDDIAQIQRERLAYIDFRLYFLGSVGRNDLVKRFGIKEAAATRDLAQYRDLAPQNIEYDTKAKLYKVSDEFCPLFRYKQERVLSALSKGIGDDSVLDQKGLIPCETPSQLSNPDLDVLSVLTRAIYNRLPVEIEYRSLSSGFSKREVVPFYLVDNGLRWHIRAYDRRRNRFTDFVITRITQPKLLADSRIEEHEESKEDIQWNRIVELELVAHPRLDHKETIEADYGMIDGVLPLKLRAAVAGYLLRRWNVDCSAKGILDGAEYHLWLRNRQALYGVDNLMLAPGFEADPL